MLTLQQQQAIKADILAKQAAGQPLEGVNEELGGFSDHALRRLRRKNWHAVGGA